MNKNYYITTPIYYPSARPHMGHAYSSIIADFFARIMKIQGFNVFFLTGTDEHGQKIQEAADKNNISPKMHVDKYVKRFKNVWKKKISYLNKHCPQSWTKRSRKRCFLENEPTTYTRNLERNVERVTIPGLVFR